MSDNAALINNLPPRQYLRERRKFSIKVYSLFFVFVVISLLQWIPLILLSEAGIFLKDHFYISVIWLTVALIAITIFVFSEKIRFLFPINWFITIIIVEGVILGLARAIVTLNLKMFAIAFGGALIIVIVLIIIGTTIPHDLTMDVIILFVLSVVLFISALFFMIIFILANLRYYNYVFAIFVFVTVSLFVMYHSQTIYGSRYAEMRIKDYLLAALILYHDFVILFILVFYLTSEVAVTHADDRMLLPADKSDVTEISRTTEGITLCDPELTKSIETTKSDLPTETCSGMTEQICFTALDETTSTIDCETKSV